MKNSFLSLIAASILFIGYFRANAQFNAHDSFVAQKLACQLKTGISMQYIDKGNLAGEPLIMLHGFTDTGRSFSRVANELSARDPRLRILLPDLRGHGNSSMPAKSVCAESPGECFSIGAFADDILDLMDQLQIEKVYLAGHSLGSIVAQHLAIRHPDRIKGVILISTALSGKDNGGINEFILDELVHSIFREQVERLGLRWPDEAYDLCPADLGNEIVKFLRENWVTESIADTLFLTRIAHETVRVKLGTWIGSAVALSQFDQREAMESLIVPALVLHATHDFFFAEVPEQEEVRKVLAKAAIQKQTRISCKKYGKPAHGIGEGFDLGHNFIWAAPVPVADDILGFIRNGEPERTHTYLNEANELVTQSEAGNILLLNEASGPNALRIK
jgi:pimeloyl-ACP methyl ester carboxylesterase